MTDHAYTTVQREKGLDLGDKGQGQVLRTLKAVCLVLLIFQ